MMGGRRLQCTAGSGGPSQAAWQATAADGLHLACLPLAQRRFWEDLPPLPGNLILCGGTALALRLGHRHAAGFEFYGADGYGAARLRRELGFLGDATISENPEWGLTAILPGGQVTLRFPKAYAEKCFPLGEPLRADNGVPVASVPELFGGACIAVQMTKAPEAYMDICAILERTGYSLEDGLGFSVAGDRLSVPYMALQALACHDGLDGRLDLRQRALLLDAVRSVDLHALPSCPPLNTVS